MYSGYQWEIEVSNWNSITSAYIGKGNNISPSIYELNIKTCNRKIIVIKKNNDNPLYTVKKRKYYSYNPKYDSDLHIAQWVDKP